MRIDEKLLIAQIKKSISENVASEDREAFAECIKYRLEDMIFLSDIDVEDKYGELLSYLMDMIDEADATEGINRHLIAAALP